MENISTLSGDTIKLNEVYCSDCISFMENLPDNCIDLTVTSPPYDNLRDYNGYSFDCNADVVRVLNLNDTSKAAVLNKSGEVLETSMDDIEISIVLAYWNKNKQFAED